MECAHRACAAQPPPGGRAGERANQPTTARADPRVPGTRGRRKLRGGAAQTTRGGGTWGRVACLGTVCPSRTARHPRVLLITLAAVCHLDRCLLPLSLSVPLGHCAVTPGHWPLVTVCPPWAMSPPGTVCHPSAPPVSPNRVLAPSGVSMPSHATTWMSGGFPTLYIPLHNLGGHSACLALKLCHNTKSFNGDTMKMSG